MAFEYDGKPLAPEHGGPARLVVPGALLLEERQVDPRHPDLRTGTSPGSGSRSAITTAATNGSKSGTRATDAAPARHLRLMAIAWQLATVVAVRDETPTVRSFTLGVPAWAGHRPGQHVDLRLTAEDGYSVERSYSIASEPERTGELDITVERIEGGEVSPFLHDVVVSGRPAGAARADRRLLRLGGGARRTAAARRRRLGRRAADGDGAAPRPGGLDRPDAAAVQLPRPG